MSKMSIGNINSGSYGIPVMMVVPMEQPQTDGTISVKQLESTAEDTAANTAFDAYLFGNQQAPASVAYLTNSYNLATLTVFDDLSLTGVTVMQIMNVDGVWVCVQPTFFDGEECPA